MAREKMMKMRIKKVETTECVFCNLYERTKETLDEKRQTMKDDGITNVINSWDAMEKISGTDGYKVNVTRPETEKDEYYRTEDGYVNIANVYICKKCADSLVKCLTRIDDAEEICFSKADSFKDIVLPTENDLIEKEEEI